MTLSLKNEVQLIMTHFGYDFPIDDFKTLADWWDVTAYPILSEEFIDFFNRSVIWMIISKVHAGRLGKNFCEKYKSRISFCKIGKPM